MEYVALDWETANRYPGGGCALALVRFDEEGQEKDHWYSLLRPRTAYFDPWMTRVHGLSSADCLASPEFPALWPEIRRFIGGDLVVAHNAAFDIGVLEGALEVYDLPPVEIHYACTCNLARRLWRGLSSYRLSALADYLDLADYKAHYALDDAITCGKLFWREAGGHLLDEKELERYLVSKGYLTKVMRWQTGPASCPAGARAR